MLSSAFAKLEDSASSAHDVPRGSAEINGPRFQWRTMLFVSLAFAVSVAVFTRTYDQQARLDTALTADTTGGVEITRRRGEAWIRVPKLGWDRYQNARSRAGSSEREVSMGSRGLLVFLIP